MQPSNEAELCNAVATSVAIDDKPSCFRFPRGNGLGVDLASYGVGPDFKGVPWEVRLSSCQHSILCVRACVRAFM